MGKQWPRSLPAVDAAWHAVHVQAGHSLARLSAVLRAGAMAVFPPTPCLLSAITTLPAARSPGLRRHKVGHLELTAHTEPSQQRPSPGSHILPQPPAALLSTSALRPWSHPLPLLLVGTSGHLTVQLFLHTLLQEQLPTLESAGCPYLAVVLDLGGAVHGVAGAAPILRLQQDI